MMKNIKKILTLFLVLTLLVFPTYSVSAKTIKPVDREKITKIVNEMNRVVEEEAPNINLFRENDKTFDIIIDGKKEGSVRLQNEKVDDSDGIILFDESHVYDGTWVYTVTYSIGIGGDAVLKVHYTVAGGATRAYPTDTESFATPPIGYFVDSTSDYYTTYDSTMFTGYGTYTYKMPVVNLPLTYKITSGFGLWTNQYNNMIVSSGISIY